MNGDESLREGLCRELAEELGLFVEPSRLVEAFCYPEPTVRVFVFTLRVVGNFSPSFPDHEHDAHVWTTWDTLPSPLVQPLKDFPVALRRVAQAAK